MSLVLINIRGSFRCPLRKELLGEMFNIAAVWNCFIQISKTFRIEELMLKLQNAAALAIKRILPMIFF